MNTLLLIEDDLLLGQGLVSFFESNGYQCLWVQMLRVSKLGYEPISWCLIDNLEDGDSLRHLPNWLLLVPLPVIVLTAKVEVQQRG
ncbi:hypothetical protein O9929_26085 [Vibrio lentus]|nr:hypothetical protein [Vibrio lentus]